MNAAGCHGAPRSFPDVQFPPVQHGVRKVRLRLMLHTSSKVSPLLFYLKESNLFYVGEWQHISQVFPGLSEWVNTFDNTNGCCKACCSLACGASLPPFQYLLTAASVSCFQVCANPCCKEQTNIVCSGVCVCIRMWLVPHKCNLKRHAFLVWMTCKLMSHLWKLFNKIRSRGSGHRTKLISRRGCDS